MSLAGKLCEFLDPQMALKVLAPENKDLKLHLLEKTLLADQFEQAGGAKQAADAMRATAGNATDADTLYSAGHYQKALDAGAQGWTKFACLVMLGDHQGALALAPALEEKISVSEDAHDSKSMLTQLYQQAWLVHWVCFAHLSAATPQLAELADFLMQSQCITTIQAVSPWILRYLVVATVLSTPANSKKIKELVKVVTQELYEYTDSVLDFVVALYVQYKEPAALASKLAAAKADLARDPLTANLADQFANSANLLIVDAYAKSHWKVNQGALAASLGLDQASVAAMVPDIYTPHTSINAQLTERAQLISERAAAAVAHLRAKE